MTVRRLAESQPESFAFTPENAAWAEGQIGKYPEGRQASAVIALLWRAQEQSGGWLPEPAIRLVAEMLDMPGIRVLEIATFYSMFNLAPVSRHHVQLCGTTPCWLRGAGDLRAVCERVIGEQNHVTADGALSWVEVECLGACCNAPMAQINDDYYEDLSPHSFEQLLDDLRAGRHVRPGSRTGRVSSEPAGGLTTLTDSDLFELWKSRAKPGLVLPEEVVAEVAPAAGVPPETPAARAEDKAKPVPLATAEAEAARTPAPPHGVLPQEAPMLFTARPADGVDHLQRITGVGPKLEALLNELGVYRFEQIASWTQENVAWVDSKLAFHGRIARDRWIEQARLLASDKGGE